MLIVTRNRRHWLPDALECARRQTYSPKELLVVSSGQDVSDLMTTGKHLHLPGNPSIGEMRNLGCERAAGEIIAHFDDDDWSSPGRLADQVGRIEETGLPVTGYRNMRFTDGSGWWLYRGGPGYALGTSLCYRRDWWKRHPFKALSKGEDNQFVGSARQERAIAAVDAGEMMWATIHPENTCPRNLCAEGGYIPL